VTSQRTKSVCSKNLRQYNGNKSNGFISERSKSKLKNIIINFCTTEQNYIKEIISNSATTTTDTNNLVEHTLKFVTLTFPPTITEDDTVLKKKYLNIYLTWLLRNGVTHYLWTAEVQGNGRLHFHLVVNGWHQQHATKWQTMTGNATKYAIQERPVRNIVGLANYMTKEQDTKARKIEGRLFGMSKNMKEFESIKITGSIEEREFVIQNKGQLSLEFENEYVAVLKYKYSLKRKIHARFLKIRRQQAQDINSFSIVVGKNSYKPTPVNSV
jgi:hypothetical protein